jgi:hypothetical protein
MNGSPLLFKRKRTFFKKKLQNKEKILKIHKFAKPAALAFQRQAVLKNLNKHTLCCTVDSEHHGLINSIDNKAKCRHLKN